VAHRLARQARLAEAARARRERRAATARAGTTADDPGWAELLRILDGELRRLPERERLPLLLCYLEGRTQDEAARQLGWSLSTLRRRLESGRELLRVRLIRRGATLGAALFAEFLAPSAAPAALPVELRRAILTMALPRVPEVTVPASVLVLVNGSLRMATLTKIILWSTLVLAGGGVLAGVMRQTGAVSETDEVPGQRGPVLGDGRPAQAQAPRLAEDPNVRRDRFNVPLPRGAVARLGTVAFRHGGVGSHGSLTYSPDGKHLISTGAGWVRRWDLATGQALVNVGYRFRPRCYDGAELVTADGKLACIYRRVSLRDPDSGWQCGQYDLESGNLLRTYQVSFPRDNLAKIVLWSVLALAIGGVLLRVLRQTGVALTAGAALGPGKGLPAAALPRVLVWSAFAAVMVGVLAGLLRQAGAAGDRGFDRPRYLAPDGLTYAELNLNGAITLWDAADGAVRHHLKPADGACTALAFTSDGKTFLVGDDRHTVHVFDRLTGKELRSFRPREGNAISRMAISPDGKWLVTAAGKKGRDQQDYFLNEHHNPSDRFLRLWELETGTEAQILEVPEDRGTWSLQFTPDSRTVLAGTRGGNGPEGGRDVAVRSWDVATGKPGRAWTDDPAIGTTLAVSPDGKELATLEEDSGVIRFWDLATGKEKRPRQASPCGLGAVRYRPDGKTLITVGTDCALREWEAATGCLLGPPRMRLKHSRYDLTAGGKVLVSEHDLARDTDAIRLYEAGTGKLLQEQPGWGGFMSPDGKRLAAWSQGGYRLAIFDADMGKEIQSWVLSEEMKTASRAVPFSLGCRFSPDGQSLIVLKEALSVWDVRTGRQTTLWDLRENKVLETPDEPASNIAGDRIDSVAVSPDGSSIAFTLFKIGPPRQGRQDWCTRLMVFETKTGRLRFQADREDEWFGTLAFSPDGKQLAVGGVWTVSVWNVANGKPTGQFEVRLGGVSSLAFSPDSKRLASASTDSTVLIWDVSR